MPDIPKIRDEILGQFMQFIGNIDDAALGKLIKDYATETSHNNWDGWEDIESDGACQLLLDIMMFHKHS